MTVWAPSSVWRTPCSTTVDGALGLGADLGDEVGDRGGGLLGLLGELADLLGDDGEALALLAGARGLDGGVERQQVGLLGDAGDGVDDPADPAGLVAQLADGGADVGGGALDSAHGLVDLGDGLLADLGARRGPRRRPERSRRRSRRTRGWPARPPRSWRASGRRRGPAPRRRWRPGRRTAAISPMARPTSSVVEAIWRLELFRVGEVPEMARTTEATRSRISMKALRRASRSERGVISTAKLPEPISPAARGGLVQVVDDIAEGAAHLGDLVAALDVDVLIDVALGQRLGGLEHLADAADDPAREQQHDPDGQRHAEQSEDDRDDGRGVLAGAGVLVAFLGDERWPGWAASVDSSSVASLAAPVTSAVALARLWACGEAIGLAVETLPPGKRLLDGGVGAAVRRGGHVRLQGGQLVGEAAGRRPHGPWPRRRCSASPSAGTPACCRCPC